MLILGCCSFKFARDVGVLSAPYSGAVAVHIIGDRDQWRRLVNTVINL
jgi:hypothetical protein